MPRLDWSGNAALEVRLLGDLVLRQLDPVERSFGSVGQNIKRAAWIDANVTNAAELIFEQMMLAEHAIAGEIELDHDLPASVPIHISVLDGPVSMVSPEGAIEIGTQ